MSTQSALLPRMHRRRAVTAIVIGLLIAMLALTITVGTFEISPQGVWQVLTGGGNEMDRYIVLNQRLPRVVAALAVGASLGLAGSIFQSVSRNPLGSPDIIGFTTGSATGALVVLLLHSHVSDAAPGANSVLGVGAGAIMGGFFTAALVLLFAGKSGQKSMGQSLILIGIAMGAMLSAINDFLLTRADLDQAESAKTWLFGSLNAMTWNASHAALLGVIIAIPLVLSFSRVVRVLELGDDLAAGLGLPVRAATYWLIGGAVVLTSLSIVIAGPIGFLALMAPQLAHRLWKTPGAALWQSALMGALMLVIADFIAARALAPFQIPVGLVTGAIGGLYMLWFIVRHR